MEDNDESKRVTIENGLARREISTSLSCFSQ